METSGHRYERGWATGLIVIGVVLLVGVGLFAIAILRDPGTYYETWVPDDETAGPEASYERTSSGLAVAFTDTSAIGDNTIERWEWDFGDGTDSRGPKSLAHFHRTWGMDRDPRSGRRQGRDQHG